MIRVMMMTMVVPRIRFGLFSDFPQNKLSPNNYAAKIEQA